MLFVLVPFAALRFAFQENQFCGLRKTFARSNLALVFVLFHVLQIVNFRSDELHVYV